jgi:hypothetical protein
MNRSLILAVSLLAAACDRIESDAPYDPQAQPSTERAPVVPASSEKTEVAQAGARETSKSSAPVASTKGKEFTVKEARPRLGPTQARAKAYFAAHPFTPAKNDPFALAFHYLCVGDTPEGIASAKAAADLLLAWTLPAAQLKSETSDSFRTTDWIPYVLDWCWDKIPNDKGQRDAFIALYQSYIDHFQFKYGAKVGFEIGNYYWGYRRNEVLFSIATYHENKAAPKTLDTFFDKFWPAFVERAAGNLKGGIWPEGDQYGPYMGEYSAQILAACFNCGRDLTQETTWFTDEVDAFLLRSAPRELRPRGTATALWSAFPSGDDGDNYAVAGYPDVLKPTLHKPGTYIGDLMTILASMGNGHARWWLQQTKAPVSRHWQAWDQGGKAVAPETKSLFASGMGWLLSRDAAATWMVQGNRAGSSHEHLDIGNVQLLYDDEFVLKETSGYSLSFPDGSAIRQTKYHNCPTYGGSYHTKSKGEITYVSWQANAYENGPAAALDHYLSDDFDYLALDLTKAYRAKSNYELSDGPLAGVLRDDCPFAGQTIREVLILRHGFGSALVVDRLTADTKYPKAAKIQNWHTVSKPTQDDAGLTGVVGKQAVRIMPVVGEPEIKLVDEGDGVTNRSLDRQWRIELTAAKSPSEVLVTLIQGRGKSASDVKVKKSEDPKSWTMTITGAAGSYDVTVPKGAGWTARPKVSFQGK